MQSNPSIKTEDDFANFVKEIQSREGYRAPALFAVGLATYNGERPLPCGKLAENARVLEVWYPLVNYLEVDKAARTAAILRHVTDSLSGSGTIQLTLAHLETIHDLFAPYQGKEGHPNVDVFNDFGIWANERTDEFDDLPQRVVVTFIDDLAEEPVDAYDAYLRLHALSYRKLNANEAALTPGKAMPLLANVAWTNRGPVLAEDLPKLIREVRLGGDVLRVYCVDKVPHMLDFVYPSGVRIANTTQVRLGANLGEGVTVMPVGAANFNSQADGPNMIEGRLSSKVRIGKGTDLGGGSSTMGTMSGGNTTLVSIGENSLIGANAGTAIPLGNNCKVEADLYVKKGRRFFVVQENRWVDASELAGQDNLTFRLNTELGRAEVVPTKGTFALNTALHANTNEPVKP